MDSPHPHEHPDGARLARAALRLVEEIDRDRTAFVWDRASPRARASTPTAEFAAAARQLRAAQGQLRSRTLAAVLRNPDDASVLHVVFESRFSSWVGEEMITLEHEAGDVWRLVGYSARPQSAT